MQFITLRFCTLLFVVSMLAARSEAAVIVADTTGADTFTSADFYGIDFASGAGAIQSVLYDLSVDGDAFFDFDGASSYNDETAPVLGTLSGLVAGDISFVLVDDALHPTQVRVDFAPGSFQAGDSMRFAMDTDFLFSDPAPGSVFGDAGVPITVTLYGGFSETANFVRISDTQSVVTLNVVPEPAALLLAGIATLGLLADVRRRRLAHRAAIC